MDWDNEPGYLPQFIEYTISPSGNDLEDFRLSNYTAGQYTLGDVIDCRESSSGFNIQTYGLHGFSPTENYTWTTANEFMMAVELTQKPQKDILVSVDLHSVYSPPQQVLISVNGQTVLETTVAEPGVLQFLVPQNLAQADKLEFTFNIPNARSPKELGASEDIRKIGLGISQIVMEEENLSSLEKLAIEEQAEPYSFGNEIVFSEALLWFLKVESESVNLYERQYKECPSSDAWQLSNMHEDIRVSSSPSCVPSWK